MTFFSSDLHDRSYGFDAREAPVARRQFHVSVLMFACFGAASAFVLLS